ncbi:type II toxin-antitoxin system RelE/ParE family toxin [Desulfonauticus submarinus]
MMEISFSQSFKRAFKKKIKNSAHLEGLFWDKVEKFINNPFDRELKTHKLSGNLKDLWSFRVDYDMRVIFFFEGNDKAIFIDIGSHDEVY